jgi:3-phenylpropionate/trans-cinnamate dioxygenase ferredoxin reductase subunit
VAPYERPALSKALLAGQRQAGEVGLRPAAFWAETGIHLLLGRRVVAVDPRGGTATTDRGDELLWDALVLATGARPKCPPSWSGPGVHVLRTLADALALRDELGPGRRLSVVGAGFIGTEVASTAAELGADVALVDVAASPLERVLGREVGDLLALRYRAHGIDLRLGAGVERLERGGDRRPRALVLDDGSRIETDVVLVAVGVGPDIRLALAAEVDGVPTDACGRTAVPRVFACGDVAAAWHPLLQRRLRVEHWTSAAGQGAAVAHALLGQERPFQALPYFWSDQFGARLQYIGHAEAWASVELDGGPESFVARYADSDGCTLAVLAVNRTAEVGELRTELAVATRERVLGQAA